MTSPLADALTKLSALMPGVRYPLPIDGAGEMQARAEGVARQVEDYLLPRAQRLDAPLLAVVGGSTGAGKSTLVNSLLGAAVTKAGVRRPTTTAPTLICNPVDRDWFRSGALLPGLTRSDEEMPGSRALRIVPSEAIPAGLALLDAPDIDSVDDENRRLSRQLLAAADLWIFVTTAARYADAVAWELLVAAAGRNAVMSLVLNRCPAGLEEDLTSHLKELLIEREIRVQQVFTITEQPLDGNGLVPQSSVLHLRRWVAGLALDQQERHAVATQTLVGALRGLDGQLAQLARGASAQTDTVTALREVAASEFRRAQQEITLASGDGSMLRGEVLARWQDLVGTGEIMRGLEKRLAGARDRMSEWLTGRKRSEPVEQAITEGLAVVIQEHGTAACERAAAHWALTGWGRALVDGDGDSLARPSLGFPMAATELVDAWQKDVLSMVDQEGRGKRRTARLLALGTNATGLALMMVVFAATGGLTATEVGIAGGTSVLAQRLLESVFGDDAVRRLANRARERLDSRVADLLATQQARFDLRLDLMAVQTELATDLTHAAEQLRAAGAEAFEALTRPEGF